MSHSTGSTVSSSIQETRPFVKKYALAILTSLYFSWGFITCLNDILIPHLKMLFTLSYAQAVLIQFVFFSSYFLMSIPSSWFCERVGYGSGMSVGLSVAAVGALGFLAAAEFQQYSIFLGSLFILASGITLLQVAANPYVSLMGNPESASSRLTWVQGFNSLGTTIAPVLGSVLILSSSSIGSIQKPYLILGIVLFIMAFMIRSLRLPDVRSSRSSVDQSPWLETLKNRELLLGALGIFTYVGAEVSIGSFLVSWLGEPSVGSMEPARAGKFVAFYWGGAMVGRFLGTPLLNKFSVPKVSRSFVFGAIVCILISMLTQNFYAVASILAVGLFNSILFPVIFAETISKMKRGVERASGVLCSAIVGGALVPLIHGVLADEFGLRVSFVTPLICYLYLLWFVGRNTTKS